MYAFQSVPARIHPVGLADVLSERGDGVSVNPKKVPLPPEPAGASIHSVA